MKIKDKDLELLLKELEKDRDEIEEGIRRLLTNLKMELRRGDWHCATVTSEDLMESLTQIMMLEEVLEKIKQRVEE